MNAVRLIPAILHGHLRLPVWPQARDDSLLPQLCQTLAEPVRKDNGKWHELGRLGAGKTEHKTLIPCAQMRKILVDYLAAFLFKPINAFRNVARLFFDRHHDARRLPLKTLFSIGVADIFNNAPRDFLDVHITCRGNFPRDKTNAVG